MRIALTLIIFFTLCILESCLNVEKSCTTTVSSDLLGLVNEAKLQQDVTDIDDYLSTNSIIAIEDPTGLRYVITQSATGATPCLESLISVKYKGKFLVSGTEFESTSVPVLFTLNGLILGWQIAFLKFPKGTKATLYIPSGLAYGPTANGTIPANSILVFDVELVDFSQ